MDRLYIERLAEGLNTLAADLESYSLSLAYRGISTAAAELMFLRAIYCGWNECAVGVLSRGFGYWFSAKEDEIFTVENSNRCLLCIAI